MIFLRKYFILSIVVIAIFSLLFFLGWNFKQSALNSSKSAESIKTTNNDSQNTQLGIYSLEKNAGFVSAVNSAFNFVEFKKMYNENIKARTPYESNDEYNARVVKSIAIYNSSVASYLEKTQRTKYVTLKMTGIKDYRTQYDPNKKVAIFTFKRGSYDYDFPKKVYLYGDPIITREGISSDNLSFGKKLSEGIEIDKETANANNIAYNYGELLITFRLDVKKGTREVGKNYIYDLSTDLSLPSMQVIKCEWVVSDKKLWSWESEGEFSGASAFAFALNNPRLAHLYE